MKMKFLLIKLFISTLNVVAFQKGKYEEIVENKLEHLRAAIIDQKREEVENILDSIIGDPFWDITSNSDLFDTIKSTVNESRKILDLILKSASRRLIKPTDVSPAFRWAQDEYYVYIQVKPTRRWNAPGAIDILDPLVEILQDTVILSASSVHSDLNYRFKLQLKLFDFCDTIQSNWMMGSLGIFVITLRKLRRSMWKSVIRERVELDNMHEWNDRVKSRDDKGNEKPISMLRFSMNSPLICRDNSINSINSFIDKEYINEKEIESQKSNKEIIRNNNNQSIYCVVSDSCVTSCDECSSHLQISENKNKNNNMTNICVGPPNDKIVNVKVIDKDTHLGAFELNVNLKIKGSIGDIDFIFVFLEKSEDIPLLEISRINKLEYIKESVDYATNENEIDSLIAEKYGTLIDKMLVKESTLDSLLNSKLMVSNLGNGIIDMKTFSGYNAKLIFVPANKYGIVEEIGHVSVTVKDLAVPPNGIHRMIFRDKGGVKGSLRGDLQIDIRDFLDANGIILQLHWSSEVTGCESIELFTSLNLEEVHTRGKPIVHNFNSMKYPEKAKYIMGSLLYRFSSGEESMDNCVRVDIPESFVPKLKTSSPTNMKLSGEDLHIRDGKRFTSLTVEFKKASNEKTENLISYEIGTDDGKRTLESLFVQEIDDDIVTEGGYYKVRIENRVLDSRVKRLCVASINNTGRSRLKSCAYLTLGNVDTPIEL